MAADPLREAAVRVLCRIDGCERQIEANGARGMCRMHYKRWRKTGDPGGAAPLARAAVPIRRTPAAERFWDHVDITDDHWLWTGATSKGGYGNFGVGGRRGATVKAHRWAYEHMVGPIPAGLEVDHKCRVTNCVNPAHLEPVTRLVNAQRATEARVPRPVMVRPRLAPPRGATAVNARKTYCSNGHEFTPENTYLTREGWRQCRACKTARQAADTRSNHQRRPRPDVAALLEPTEGDTP